MPDAFPFCQEDDHLGDVRGVVGNPFQVLGDEQNPGGPRRTLRVLRHEGEHGVERSRREVVDEVVPLTHAQGQFRVFADKRVQAIAQHGARPFGHLLEVNIEFEGRFLVQLDGPFADVLCDIPDPFEIGRDLRARHDESQVAGGRLVQRDEAGAGFIDSDVEIIDHVVPLNDRTRFGGIPFDQRVHGVADLPLDQPPHLENLRPELL